MTDKKIVILYQASISYSKNGVVIYKQEFIETARQFKSIGDWPHLVPKNDNGQPGMGYSRTIQGAIDSLRLRLKYQVSKLQNELAQVYAQLNIVESTKVE